MSAAFGMPLCRHIGLALAVGALALLQACASAPSRTAPGATRAEVTAQSGRPTSVYPLAGGGERLQYSELPAGLNVHNLDFDAQGRLVRSEQALTLASFHRIEMTRWTKADVQLQFGAPYRVERVARFDGDIWTYRFRDLGNIRQAHAHFDPQGVVRKLQFTDEQPEFDLLPR